MLIIHIIRALKALKIDAINYQVPKKNWKPNNNKILLIGMLDSPHFQKWLRFLYQEFPERKILVFPSDRPKSKINVIVDQKGVLIKSILIFQLVPFRKLNFAIYYTLDTLIGIGWRSYFLARYISRHKPSIIHFHEMQHGAYIYNQIVNHKKTSFICRKIISTWGSDLTLYSWVDVHRNQIKTSLSWADILTAEREFEIEDAERLGFKNDFRAPVYVTLGQDILEPRKEIQPSLRRLILVKGHQSDTGRALNVLQAISQLGSQLKDFEILVYSASHSVKVQVDILRNKNKINIRTISNVSNYEMRNLFFQARVSISVAVSDGLPGVLVEAMQAGAFPIQSSNSAGKDFIAHGENGFLVEPWDIESVKNCILDAINNHILVDHASGLNNQILKDKYSLQEGIQKLRKLYL